MTCRIKKFARAYLRRSSEKQENSLESQLRWAKLEAKKYKLVIEATLQDVEYMIEKGLHAYKDLFLDDAISGAELDRPGLQEMIGTVINNVDISHVFIFKRDRLARPEEPIEAAAFERSMTIEGVTLVFSDDVTHPSDRGNEADLKTLLILLQYWQSGAFLKQLADRVLRAHLINANKGHWNGGNAPYGFIRVLVDQSGKVLDTLVPGKRVKQAGCHIEIRPHDLDKVATWVEILDLRSQGWGITRISNFLNAKSIPSPHKGRARKDRGILHRVSGTWSPKTVGNLCKNQAILGILEYGRRSMGKHRRIGVDGPRLLTKADRIDGKQTKGIVNGSDVRVTAQLSYDAKYDPDSWHQLQTQIMERSQSQRGLARSKDPTKYPLSCRVFDLTEGCGWTMIGTTYGKRKVYTCGRYRKSAGAECYHNQIDANTLLDFAISDLRSKLITSGDRRLIREFLMEKVKKDSNGDGGLDQRMKIISAELVRLERCKQTLVRRVREEGDDDLLYPILKGDLAKVLTEIAQNEKRLNELQASVASVTTIPAPEQEVENALSLIDMCNETIDNPGDIVRVQQMLLALGINIGLNFGEDQKGKRKVRKLLGGMITTANHPLSVPIYGKNNLENSMDTPTSSTSKNGSSVNSLNGDEELMELSKSNQNQRKGKSLRKVNNGVPKAVPPVLAQVKQVERRKVVSWRHHGQAGWVER